MTEAAERFERRGQVLVPCLVSPIPGVAERKKIRMVETDIKGVYCLRTNRHIHKWRFPDRRIPFDFFDHMYLKDALNGLIEQLLVYERSVFRSIHDARRIDAQRVDELPRGVQPNTSKRRR